MLQRNLENLQDIYSRVLLIPVIGSGISIPFGLPDWKKLIQTAAEWFHLPEAELLRIEELLDRYEFLEAVDVIVGSGIAEETLQTTIAEIIVAAKERNSSEADNNYTDLAQKPRLRYITTNYDEYLNDIAGASTFLLDQLKDIKVNEFALSRYDNVVIPLHGEVSRPQSIVFTRESYDRLYEGKEFDRNFQHLRTHFTFLFMGFSFDDPYFQKLFERVVNRYEATHYILLEEKQRVKNKDKIARLQRKYGVEAVFFDAPDSDYVKGIRVFLQQVFQLRDSAVDVSALERLPEKRSDEMTKEERKISTEGRAAIREERLSDVLRIYAGEYHSPCFHEHTGDFQVEVISGLSWYYGYRKQNESSERLFKRELANPKIQKRKLVFMYGQLLWNLREYDQCIELLEKYSEEADILCLVLLDIVRCFKKLLPDRSVMPGEIKVYGDTDLPDDEKNERRALYRELKKKYINEETCNLLQNRCYKDADSQHIVYYWLGITAGQLFHEHKDAIEYLNRAYELAPSMSVCEELAHNYLADAESDIRYNKHAKTHEMNMNSLLKAKIRFQYVLNFNDAVARNSFYKSCGYAYLRTLFLLREYYQFEEFYRDASKYNPPEYDVLRMKAEADVYYHLSADPSIVEELKEEDRLFIEFLSAKVNADYLSARNPEKAADLRRDIISRSKELEQPILDQRIFQIVLDNVIFSGAKDYYEEMTASCPAEYFKDVRELGFEDELYGRVENARAKFEKAFDVYGDYLGTFQILRGFYLRNQMREELSRLYERLLQNPPDKMFETPRFVMEYILTEVMNWQDSRNALRLYARYHERMEADEVLRKELEELLRDYAADYGEYEERIAWNRYMLLRAPVGTKGDIYLSIVKLYTANMEYRKAEEVLEEMKRQGILMPASFDRLVLVCLRKQKKEYYSWHRPLFSSQKEFLDKVEREVGNGWRFLTPYFGCRGRSVLLSMKQVICLFRHNRQKELKGFSQVFITYAGLLQLQNSLMSHEDPFLRMILQGLAGLEQITLAAPDFLSMCEAVSEDLRKREHIERIQIRLFARQHPFVVNITDPEQITF